MYKQLNNCSLLYSAKLEKKNTYIVANYCRQNFFRIPNYTKYLIKLKLDLEKNQN